MIEILIVAALVLWSALVVFKKVFPNTSHSVFQKLSDACAAKGCCRLWWQLCLSGVGAKCTGKAGPASGQGKAGPASGQMEISSFFEKNMQKAQSEKAFKTAKCYHFVSFKIDQNMGRKC